MIFYCVINNNKIVIRQLLWIRVTVCVRWLLINLADIQQQIWIEMWTGIFSGFSLLISKEVCFWDPPWTSIFFKCKDNFFPHYIFSLNQLGMNSCNDVSICEWHGCWQPETRFWFPFFLQYNFFYKYNCPKFLRTRKGWKYYKSKLKKMLNYSLVQHMVWSPYQLGWTPPKVQQSTNLYAFDCI